MVYRFGLDSLKGNSKIKVNAKKDKNKIKQSFCKEKRLLIKLLVDLNFLHLTDFCLCSLPVSADAKHLDDKRINEDPSDSMLVFYASCDPARLSSFWQLT